MKKTPWFNAFKHKPVRIGLYEFYDSLWGKIEMMYWNGKYWTWDDGVHWSLYSGDKWRGLLTPPNDNWPDFKDAWPTVSYTM